ncbi:uncharacterized protein LOC119729748 [Patiria miniata]|uniref:Uncharacterized protein n=1 Tax=Patiria miniata TaxID=46514 RepID=A0A914A4A8_PATMI|nr:uncharacterized protein LOC119729748 [Patiria miniata]
MENRSHFLRALCFSALFVAVSCSCTDQCKTSDESRACCRQEANRHCGSNESCRKHYNDCLIRETLHLCKRKRTFPQAHQEESVLQKLLARHDRQEENDVINELSAILSSLDDVYRKLTPVWQKRIFKEENDVINALSVIPSPLDDVYRKLTPVWQKRIFKEENDVINALSVIPSPLDDVYRKLTPVWQKRIFKLMEIAAADMGM